MRRFRISLLEFDYHPEVLRSFCRICEGLEVELNIFTPQRIWSNVNLYSDQLPSHFALNICTDHNEKDFIKESLNRINSADLIIFNTAASKFKFYLNLIFVPPILIRIHNTNSYFGRLNQFYKVRWIPVVLWKDLSHFLRNTIFRRKEHFRSKFMGKARFYSFTSEPIRQYALKHFTIQPEKTVVLPFSFIDELKPFTSSSKRSVTCAIIGRVDPRNRDYELVVEAVQKYLSVSNFKLKLILLGSASGSYGKNIVAKLKKLESDKFELKSYDSYIPQREFEQRIQEIDFIISPVIEETRYTVFTEYYGKTKISGSVNDMIVYQKPCILPKFYPVDTALDSVVQTYSNSDELCLRMVQWSDKDNLNNLDRKSAFEPYLLQNVRKLYQETFKQISERV